MMRAKIAHDDAADVFVGQSPVFIITGAELFDFTGIGPTIPDA